MLNMVSEIISYLKWPVRFLLKTSIQSIDKQLYVLGSFFDLTKAYGVINHEILLTKLEYYGTRGTIRA